MDIVLRATAMFAIVFALLRLLGKRKLGQLAPFEVVTLVVIGDLIQQGVTHNDFSITGATIAITTFGLLDRDVGLGFISLAQRTQAAGGEPTVITKDGTILHANLRRDRITVQELESEMRLAGIASTSEGAWAILEPHGKISFIGKDQKNHMQEDEATIN